METWQLDLAGVEVRQEQQTRLVVLQKAGLQEGGRRLLRGHLILLRRQVDTETEHEHFMHRVEGGRVWLGCGKRLLDSAMRSAARAVSSGDLCFFSKVKQKKMLRRISFQAYSLLKVWESLIYAV